MSKTLCHLSLLLPLALVLAACQPETRIVEVPVDVEVTRVVEMPVEVEVEVTRVVEMPVEVEVIRVIEKPIEAEVTRVVEMPAPTTATPTDGKPPETPTTEPPGEVEPTPTTVRSPETVSPLRFNVAPFGSASSSMSTESPSRAIDGDPETLWASGGFPVQWIEVAFDRTYLIDRFELLVAQTPAGETTHQIWVSDVAGVLTKIHEFADLSTRDGQTLELLLDQPVTLNRVLILTTKGPSFVAWREVRVVGKPAPQPLVDWEPAGWRKFDLGARLDKPVQITNAGDGTGRLFVVEQEGRIKVISNGHLLPSPFLDISENVACCHEQGLFNVTFPPGYDEKQYFYVNYTNAEGDTEIVRYGLSSDPNVADPDSAELILRIEQPDPVHNGGHMAFGPKDGYLYIGTGDGGPADNVSDRSQDPGSLLGKMLRIDVESGVYPYVIPDDNPFVQTEGYRGEIWSLGLRNPWGFAFDRKTGDLYISDVGALGFEEVNYQPGSSKGGENYGWPILEGIQCYEAEVCDTTGLTEPVATYPRSLGCAVIGGPVFRDSQMIPVQGIYFYADFCEGQIWGLKKVGEKWKTVLLHKVSFPITAIGEGEDGELYLTNYHDGFVFAFERLSQPSAPRPTSTAAATVEPTEAPAPLAEQGRQLFVERGCVACHVVSSVPEAVGTSGPALDGFGDPSRWPLIAGVLGNSPENVKRWILDPARFKPDTAMVNMGLSEEDAEAIVAFLRTLK